MTGPGALAKLEIRAHLKPDYKDAPKPENVFKAYINPAEITLGYEVEYDGASGAGTTGSRMEFKKIKPGELSLTFFIDGTGANGPRVDVREQVAKFQEVTGYSGHIHRTHYLKVAWGTLQVKRCVLKSASIAYKLFQPDGVPLRAVITATFADNSDDATRVAIAQDKSADLTFARLVAAGDTLPALCEQVYGDPQRYLEVACANGLDSWRLEPGTRLFFYPIER